MAPTLDKTGGGVGELPLPGSGHLDWQGASNGSWGKMSLYVVVVRRIRQSYIGSHGPNLENPRNHRSAALLLSAPKLQV